MSFKDLLPRANSAQTKQQNFLTHFCGLVKTQKGQHHILNVATGMGKTAVTAALISRLLKEGNRVLVLSSRPEEEVQMKTLSALTGLDFNNLKNSNFMSKPSTKELVEEASNKYDDKLKIEFIPATDWKKIADRVYDQKVPTYDYCILSDLDLLVLGDAFHPTMNIMVSSLTTLAKSRKVGIVSIMGQSLDAGYLKNSEVEVTNFLSPLSQNIQVILDESHRSGKEWAMVEFKKNFDVVLMDPPYTKPFDSGSIIPKTIQLLIRVPDKETAAEFQNLGRFNRTNDPMSWEQLEEEVSNLGMDLDEALDQDEVDYKLVKRLSAQINELATKLLK